MSSWLLLGAVFAVVVLLYLLWQRVEQRQQSVAAQEMQDVAAMGDVVPTTLHPTIDPDRCIASGACVAGCPEKKVLGLVAGRAELINPMACIGHGSCETACPVGAVSLVFGTKQRGVELPRLDPSFQTNQPGIYIVGELGGMGLIRNAVQQGAEAAAHIVKGSGDAAASLRRGVGDALDAIVVGAGPAGISATLGLMQGGLRTLLVEREGFGGTILHYPRGKVVMTGALDIPLYGRVRQRVMSKEELARVWRDIQARVAPPMVTEELVERLDRDADGMWVVHTNRATRRAANVILALGMRGAPAKLGIPGEELPKVAYRLLEPAEFAGRHVLVVGGGNSAVESALALSDFGKCASVTISYRREQFARCRADNRRKIALALESRRVSFLPKSQLVSISDRTARLKTPDGERDLPNDAVIVQIGGTPPTQVLKSFGIELVTKYGER